MHIITVIKNKEEKESAEEVQNGGLGILHPREINLLKKIREEYRYGVVEIQTADGLPKQIIQTVKRELLD